VPGAFIVIGLKYGKAKVGDEKEREQTYQLAQEFATRFRSRHGSICCRELLGYDLNSPEERAAGHHKGLFNTLCWHLVRDTTEILKQLL
jgi:C_GCAxxG_C_C family probable redox protein